jgi:hypothetical protein
LYLFSLALWPIYAVIGYAPGARQNVMTLITMAIVIVYSYHAFGRFYPSTTGKTLVKAALLYAAMNVVSTAILMLALVAALLSVH